MQVIIGGIDVDLSGTGVRTLGELIEAVQDAAAEKNEVIVNIALNGQQLGPDQEMAQHGRECGAADVVEFTVQNASAVLAGAIEQTRESLPVLKDKLEEVAAALQGGSRQAAFSLFSDCLIHWRQIVHLLQVSQECLGYDPKDVRVEGCSLQQMNEELLTTLQETKQAMERGDLVSLGDLVEYELSEMARQEEVVLDHLRGMVPAAT